MILLTKTKFNVLSLLLFALLVVPVCSASESSIQPDFEKVGSYITRQIKRYRIPGLALGVIYGDGKVYWRGFGRADESGREVTGKTPFIIGSVSKSFTALAIMQLAEAGKIQLSNPVADYIEWFKLADRNASEKITVRHLLTHTSGIALDAEWQVASTDGKDDLEQLVRKMERMTMAHLPGEKYEYNNANYIILGELIQTVSGMSYGDYVKKNIFEPLEMNNSFVSYNDAQKHGMAQGYVNYFGFPYPSDIPYRNDFLPAYYIVSCAEDMIHYISAMMNSGNYKDIRILSSVGIEQMMTPQVKISSWGSYGYGWFVGSNNVFHGGSTIDFQAKANMFKEHGIGTVMLYNTSDSTAAALLDASYRDILEGDVLSLIFGQEDDVGRMGSPMGAVTISIIYGAALVLIFGLVFLSILRLFAYANRVSTSGNRIKSLSGLLIQHLVLPMAIIVGVPLLADTTWEVILYHFKDVGLVALGIAGVLAIEGIY